MEEEVQYFVIFKPQKGELSPAYSFMNKDTLAQAMNQEIISKSFIIPAKQIHSKEEAMALLERYKNEK